MTDEMEIRRRRAAYRASHRGTKEMDFILGRYAEAHLPGMTAGELDDFERFLALPDPVLTEWFSLKRPAIRGRSRARLCSADRGCCGRTYHGLAGERAVRGDRRKREPFRVRDDDVRA